MTPRALLAPAAVDRSIAATDEKLPLLVPAAANTSALALATDSAPLELEIETVPVLTAATVPPSVSVVPPKTMLSLPAVLLAKAPSAMLRPSVVVSVIEFLALVLVKVAVTPLAPATPLIAETRLLRSFWSATTAETAEPLSEKLKVPAALTPDSTALLVAVAVTPTLAPAVLIAVAIASAPALAA